MAPPEKLGKTTIFRVNQKQEERVWEVDCFRGIAVLMMLVSNLVFDLSLFSRPHLSISTFWSCFARITAGLFLVLVGISLVLSYARVEARQAGLSKYLKRGLKIFGLGLVVSAVTRIAVGQDYVVFGILHLIGCIDIHTSGGVGDFLHATTVSNSSMPREWLLLRLHCIVQSWTIALPFVIYSKPQQVVASANSMMRSPISTSVIAKQRLFSVLLRNLFPCRR